MISKILWFAAGGVVGYFAAYRHFENHFTEKLHAESIRVQEHYDEQYEYKIKMRDEADGAMLSYMGESIKDTDKPSDEDVAAAEAAFEESRLNLGVPVQPAAPTEVSTAEVVAEALGVPEQIISGDATIITADDYTKNEGGAQQFSLTYWAGDDVTTGESDQIVKRETLNEVLGPQVIKKLRLGLPKGQGFLYVRNSAIGMEYEIAWSPGEYRIEVLAESAE